MLIVSQTACRKTKFIQNLAKNKIFGEPKNVFWLTKIELPKHREQNIGTCFNRVPVSFLCPQTLDDFNMHLDFFQKKRENVIVNDSVMGKKIYLISLLSWTTFLALLTDFANFLTVARKFNFSCVYVFHTIYP